MLIRFHLKMPFGGSHKNEADIFSFFFGGGGLSLEALFCLKFIEKWLLELF